MKRWFVLLLWAQLAQADPFLSIAGTETADRDYGKVLQALHDVGADATTLTLLWDESEGDAAVGGGSDWPAIANLVFPAQDLQIGLVISVVDTVADRRPADLQDLPYDDPRVLARFEAFLISVLTRMPDVTLTSIAIGNEVDGVLQGAEWDQYALFFVAAQEVAHQLRPGVPVGMTLTWAGLSGPDRRAAALGALGDVWMINYYPLLAGFQIDDPAQVAAQLDAMLALTGAKPLYLTEIGYPSAGCGATEAGQLTFVQEVMTYGAAHATRVLLVNLVWLHDISAAEVDQFAAYYGVAGDCFAAYLASLGLRHANGSDKPAFGWLRQR